MVRFVTITDIPRTQEAIVELIGILGINKNKAALEKEFLGYDVNCIGYNVYQDKYRSRCSGFDGNVTVSYESIINENINDIDYRMFKMIAYVDNAKDDYIKWQGKKSLIAGQRVRVSFQSFKNMVTDFKKKMTDIERLWGKRQ